jgi:trehalose 6-phosphate synthase
MPARRKLIVVSNRGPVGYERDDSGGLVAKRGAGGLVTALSPLVSQHDVTWIASALSEEDRAVARRGPFEETGSDGSRYQLRLVAHDPTAYDLYYRVIANPTLWFVQHRLWELKHEPDVGLEHAWSAGYERVNRAFADAVGEELERDPDAAVLFHDYHLYLAPRLVRERRPKAVLAHFTHIPWVGPDEWSVLPEQFVRAIHESLLTSDVVGFHTERWREAFLATCTSLGLEPEGTLVTAHPISVDVAEFESLAESPAVLERERELATGRSEQLIVRVDRTDPSKNVVRGFQAFERLLERRPDLIGRVTLLALLDPSRQAISEYVVEREAIEAAAARLDARFPGSLRLRLSDDFPQSVAAYKQFDVLLVNSVMDGLNLVAKEAPLLNTRDGAVVLSVNTGAFDELGEWVLGIDPLDVEAQSVALEQALELPAQVRRQRLAEIRAHVRAHDLTRWIEAQLADLELATGAPAREFGA